MFLIYLAIILRVKIEISSNKKFKYIKKLK